MKKYISEDNILIGPNPVFEPESGGLGYELFTALNLNKGKSLVFQHIIDTGETLSYDDLLSRSVRLALFLAERGLKKDDIVCLCSGNNSHTVATLVASKFADVHFAAMEPVLPVDDVVYLLNLLQPKLLFVAEAAIPKIEEAFAKSNFKCELVSLGTNTSKYTNINQLYAPKDGEENYRPKFVENLKDTAIIFLSSGTTGKPKAVCSAIRFTNFTEENSKDRVIIGHYSPLYWISGFLQSLTPIFTEGTSLVGITFSPETAWNALEKYQPDSFTLPPGQANALCSYGVSKKPIKSVGLFGIGGGLVTVKHMEDIKKCFPNSKLTQVYGQTENSGIIATFNTNDPEEMNYQEEHLNSCGHPVAGYQLRVIDLDTDKLCGPGERGELRMKNKYIMNGYYKMDSSSAFDADGWFKTGDLVYFDENGYIYIIDRIKDLLLYTLYNITPSIIEEILQKHPAVYECCVVGKPHLKDNEHPMGIVVLKKDRKEEVTEAEIISFVNERVPDDRYKIRAGITFVDKLLRTPTGKPQKLEMKRRVREGLPF